MASIRPHRHAPISPHTALPRRVPHGTLLVNGPRFHPARDNAKVGWQGGRAYLHLGVRRDDHPDL
jgi:hypothetical protein